MSDANPRRSESLEVNEADDGLVVLDAERDVVHHLNPSASLIFDLCDGARDVDAIVEAVAKAYGLDAPPRDEILAGLADLAERGLVHWDRQADAPS